MTYAIETWRFIPARFEPNLSFGEFETEQDALRAMWDEIRSSGKDMGRFRVAIIKSAPVVAGAVCLADEVAA